MRHDDLEIKHDERGSLVEAFKLPNDGQVFYIKINPYAVRGNHYHKRKTEVFLVTEGAAVLRTKYRKTGIIEEVILNANSPATVAVRPDYTHSITALEQGATVVVWSNTRYNDKTPDTYREDV